MNTIITNKVGVLMNYKFIITNPQGAISHRVRYSVPAEPILYHVYEWKSHLLIYWFYVLAVPQLRSR